jgi:GTP-binding protein EngB required for normal cell division
MSTTESTSLDSISEYIQKIRARGDKFRVLVIGRANAGKTTILQRTCNTAEGPVIYDRAGKKVGVLLAFVDVYTDTVYID